MKTQTLQATESTVQTAHQTLLRQEDLGGALATRKSQPLGLMYTISVEPTRPTHLHQQRNQ